MHQNDGKRLVFVAIAIMGSLLTGLGANCGFTLTPSQNNGAATVKVAADFTKEVSARAKGDAAKLPCPSTPAGSDEPSFQSGLDCDGNGGVVRYITPTSFKVAIRSLVFIDTTGQALDVIADTNTLADSIVLDLSQPVTLETPMFPPGAYPTYRVEIYYFELQMPLYDSNVLKTLRVYMSDDDFPTEGNLGHHQGDITLIGEDGTEQGFVDTGALWQTAFLKQTRSTINGAGGVDTETGHLRGLYGDQTLWNESDQMQGGDQDVFQIVGPLNLVIDGSRKTVTFSFDVKDTWFFEDFDNNQLFNPCENGTQDGCGGAWSPLFNDPEVEIETSPAVVE